MLYELYGILKGVITEILAYYSIKILDKIPSYVRISDKEFYTKDAPIKLLIRIKIIFPFNIASLLIINDNHLVREKIAGLFEITIKSLLYKIVKKFSNFVKSKEIRSIKIGFEIPEDEIVENSRYFEVPIELYLLSEKKDEIKILWEFLRSVNTILDHIKEEYPLFKIEENIICEISDCDKSKIETFVKIFSVPKAKYGFQEEKRFKFIPKTKCRLELQNFTELLALEHFL